MPYDINMLFCMVIQSTYYINISTEIFYIILSVKILSTEVLVLILSTKKGLISQSPSYIGSFQDREI